MPRDACFCLSLLVLLINPAHCAEQQKWDQPTWGVVAIDIPAATKTKASGTEEIRWPTRKGALVAYVMKNSPADKAGLSPLDIIYAAGGHRIASSEERRATILKLGFDKLKVHFHRQTGSSRFRRRSIDVLPVTYREMVEAQLERTLDDATGLTHYRHIDSPETINEESSVDVFVVTDNNNPTLVMRSTYVARDWLFIESYTFLIDGKTRMTLTPPFQGVERDHETRIWEWYTAEVSVDDEKSQVLKIARALADATEAKIFYHGAQYRKEREITLEERARIMIMLEFIDSQPKHDG
jgi:hypothetical protein